MLIVIDDHSAEPLFRQIASQVRRAIAAGEVNIGDRLPPARDLAESLDVNINTVLRALAELRDEGLVEMRRGRGVTVQGKVRLAELRRQAKALAAEARKQGLSLRETVKLVEEYL